MNYEYTVYYEWVPQIDYLLEVRADRSILLKLLAPKWRPKMTQLMAFGWSVGMNPAFPGCSGLQVRWRNAFPYFLLRILVRIWEFSKKSDHPGLPNQTFCDPKDSASELCLFEEQFQSHSSYWPVAIFEASRPFLMLILLIAGPKMIMMISGPREC